MSVAPTGFLVSFNVTDLNRQTIWDSLADADRAKFGATTSTTTTGSTTGTTTSSTTTSTATTSTATTTATATGGFVSLGSTTKLSSSAFTGLQNATYSSTPTSATQAGYGKIWATTEDVQKQLTGTKGGAIFVDAKGGALADGMRPADGSKGFDPTNARGFNPYGYTDQTTSKFVQLQQGADIDGRPSYLATHFDDDTGRVSQSTWCQNLVDGKWEETGDTTVATGKTRANWEKSARVKYDQYQSLVSDQMIAATGKFDTQSMLGYDVNNNGRIDDETELFGFDSGLDISGSANITDSVKDADGNTATKSFTFLANDGRLSGDPLDPNQTSSLNDYRRFMVLKQDGSSASVLQSEIGHSASVNQYVKSQTVLKFDTTAHTATIYGVAQSGMSISQVA
jgi:hypothetical protein